MNLVKALKAGLKPSYWPALARRVVPTIEHGPPLAGIEPATVIDVGANKGQFAFFASRRWPAAKLHAFEPLPGPRSRLAGLLARRATIHACAVGAADAEAEINIASRADSSSLLPIGEEQSRIFGVDAVSTLTVPVRRLDGVLAPGTIAGPALLKIDVQGFEYEVLQGIGALAASIEWIYLEVSFLELYSGQRLFGEVDALLQSLGYRLQGQFHTHFTADGAAVQADALYVRDPGAISAAQ